MTCFLSLPTTRAHFWIKAIPLKPDVLHTFLIFHLFITGMEGRPLTDGKAKSLVAYHEVGHAICGTLTPGHDAVQKVTLIPRGQARGLTWFIPGEDPTLISKSQIFARIVGGLGGRAAEEIIFGRAEVTTGASGDLQMVGRFALTCKSVVSCICRINISRTI